jgi:hypothetical protein
MTGVEPRVKDGAPPFGQVVPQSVDSGAGVHHVAKIGCTAC